MSIHNLLSNPSPRRRPPLVLREGHASIVVDLLTLIAKRSPDIRDRSLALEALSCFEEVPRPAPAPTFREWLRAVVGRKA